MSGASNSGSSDGGVGDRIRQIFLTYMAEKKTPVFAVATANSLRNLPPELTRRGRMDDIFFVDLPNTTERREIWRIHTSVRGIELPTEDMDSLASVSSGYSGAEIEQTVVDAMWDSYEKGKPLKVSAETLCTCLAKTTPLSAARASEISSMQEWAKKNARPASSPETVFDQAPKTDAALLNMTF